MPAAGFSVSAPTGTQFEAKITPIVIISCIMAATGGLMFGYDIGISGGVTSMDDFLEKFFPAVYRRKHETKDSNYCKYDNQGLQLFTSSLYLAGLTATFVASYTSRHLGRRITMLIAGCFFIVGVILNGAAQDLAMLFLSSSQRLHPPESAAASTSCSSSTSPSDSSMGMEAVAVARGDPGVAPDGGRTAGDGHTQQPDRARAAGGRQGRAEEDPRHRQRGGGVQRDPGRQPRRQPGEAPLPQPPPPPQPAPARHRRPPPDLPAVHRHQRHHVLRSRAVQHAGVQERRLALLGGHHRSGERAVDGGVDLLGGPGGTADAAAGGRRADVPVAGGDRGGAGAEGDRPLRQPQQGVRRLRGGDGVHLRVVVRVVVGAARVADPQRDLPTGDAVGGAERDGVRQPALHLRHRAVLPLHALPPQVCHLRLLLSVGAGDVGVRALLPSGDQERAHRGDDGEGVEASLVLEEVHRRRRRRRQMCSTKWCREWQWR
ncbi:hypothetical protein Cni_G25706 [Canna indica]|uniref:Major facilitator superfamily (MFS) profile domain-containing protein n=1 Tax=Canna indica TaxID=4628 RepID=A0AAQ3QPL4_9LILI|nr:hypothetical protein Cni_G25706 [Canna indica]